MSGWDTTRAALLEVYADAKAVYTANALDNAKDADGDGVADVKQISSQDLATRKLALWAQAIKDPDKLSMALGGLYAAWLGVQSVLRIEFARTVTLGVSIAEMANPMLRRICVPFLAHVLPKPYHHWIPLVIKLSARALGVALAWRVQVVVSALHLALRGGLLCSRSLLRYAHSKGRLLRFQEEDTCVDEILGYGIAGAGFYCQLQFGFGVPFPLNVLAFPLTCVEWYIRWALTSSEPAVA